MTKDRIVAAVSAHYETALAAHGPTAKGVDWKDPAGQLLRHRQFLRLLEDDLDASVLDVGCGYGDFLSVLRAYGHRGHYAGLDIAPAMIDAARRIHGDTAQCVFTVGVAPPKRADFVVASGIFNVIRGADAADWALYVDDTIETLARSARRGFGFNMLSLNSDVERRRADLFYADPLAVIDDMISRFGRNVALLQDYGLWEFTILVRRPYDGRV